MFLNLFLLLSLLVEVFEPSSSFVRIENKPKKIMEPKSSLPHTMELGLDIRVSLTPELCLHTETLPGDESDAEEDDGMNCHSLFCEPTSYQTVLGFSPFHVVFFYLSSLLDIALKPSHPPPINA